MTYRPHKGPDDPIDSIRKMQRTASIVLAAAFAAFVLVPRIIERISRGDLFTDRVLLLQVGTVLLGGIWILTTFLEPDQLAEFLDPRCLALPSNTTQWLGAFGIVAFFALLVIAATNVLYYATIFFFYSIAALLGTQYVNRNLTTAFDAARVLIGTERDAAAKDDVEQSRLVLWDRAIDKLQTYYLHRPHLERHVALVLVAAVAAGTAGAGVALDNTTLVDFALYGLVAAIIASELWIFAWRSARDRALEEIRLSLMKSQLREVPTNR